jgi:predicted dehydrogenase
MPRSLRGARRLNVLILGWSSLATRRILPALRRAGCASIDIASRSRDVTRPPDVPGRAFRSYEQALAESDAPLVYVSTRNHEHAAHVDAALAAGRHVVVDKPATLSAAESRRLLDVAARAGRLLAEATVYPWHPQFAEALALASAHGPVERMTATFCYPPLPADNFRHRPEWGGGLLWDLGPYAVSAGRVVFGGAPISMSAAATMGAAVDTAVSTFMLYEGGRTAIGHFSMNSPYINRLELFGPALALTIERAFTTAVDQPCRLSGQAGGRQVSVDVPACDAFAAFLTDVMSAIASGDHARFTDALAMDAETLDRLRAAAGRTAPATPPAHARA